MSSKYISALERDNSAQEAGMEICECINELIRESERMGEHTFANLDLSELERTIGENKGSKEQNEYLLKHSILCVNANNTSLKSSRSSADSIDKMRLAICNYVRDELSLKEYLLKKNGQGKVYCDKLGITMFSAGRKKRRTNKKRTGKMNRTEKRNRTEKKRN